MKHFGEERRGDPTVPGSRALLRPGGGTDHRPPARSDAAVRELLPAGVQTGGENAEQLGGYQALKSAGHAPRPGDAPRGGQRRGQGGTQRTPSRTGPSGVAARNQGSPVSALAALVSPELRPTPQGESLERFLARLPDWWREEQEQAEGKPRARAPHTWRTRKDPSEGVWCDVLGWLQEEPDASAVALVTGDPKC